ncbi:TAF3 RNA polymerase II [Naegleria gruberi]|uniref:Transcription initiation factor TFIID subunit 8 n=1 Tax=Naegleria gruberi TaxID=5762 RepID=D2VE20_NAEGR|nr:TAF3 RNA polymerase II [Naegleria gruberi]EFC45001.1 TAF3 RNA polymerase II [Naegleria gruberi]|eukprot:XP_002677745.1 TAF3 RNA polymerase II [Naegleria gruberi strain NEG-M]
MSSSQNNNSLRNSSSMMMNGMNQQKMGNNNNTSRSQHPNQHYDHFAREVLQRVISDTCRYYGFHAIKSSTSDFLIDLVQMFIQKIATTSVMYSSHCGRTEPNVFDVEKSLNHHMGLDINDLLSFFYILQDKSEENSVDLSTFEFDIPDIPKAPLSSLMSCPQTHFHLLYKNKAKSLLFIDEEEEEEHERQIKLIEQQKPTFLPALPPKHTFRFTPIMNKRTRDQYRIQLEKTRQRRHIEESLTRLHEAELKQVRDLLELNEVNGENASQQLEQLIKTKKKTIVQKNDVLLHLEKKPTTNVLTQKKKEEQAIQQSITEDDEEPVEEVAVEDNIQTIVNPYLQIEKQRVSLAVQRNVTNSSSNPHNVTRLTNILTTPKKSTTIKKPFISLITRDDSAEVQANNLMKSGAIANTTQTLSTISNDDGYIDNAQITPKQKKNSIMETSIGGSINRSASSSVLNDSTLMPPPSSLPPQFAPPTFLSSLMGSNTAVNNEVIEPIISNNQPMLNIGSSIAPPPSSDFEEDEFEEVEIDEPNSKKLKF